MFDIFRVFLLVLALVGQFHSANAFSIIQYSETETMELENPEQAPLQWGFSTSPSDPTATIYRANQFDHIIDVNFNTGNIWSNAHPVEIEFRTGSSPPASFFDLQWTVTVHRVTSKAGQKKFIREGLISDSNSHQTLKPARQYRLRFPPPPAIHQPGEYIIVIIFETYSATKRYISNMMVSKPVFVQTSALQSSPMLPDKLPDDLAERTGLFIKMPTEIKHSILNKMTDAGDVCRFCSQSKVFRAECDRLFSDFLFPPDFNLPVAVPSTVQPNTKFSTSELCNIVSIDRMLQVLEFKYEYTERTRLQNHGQLIKTTIQTFEDAIIKKYGEIPSHILVWAALKYQDGFRAPFVKRYKDIIGRMGTLFGSTMEWPTIDHRVSLDKLKSLLVKLAEHSKTVQFKSYLSSRLSVVVRELHILFSFHPK
ncbi:hypothetical protein BKA69DRAFT_1041993 [Paraphysoderma sedebokerense]|nr:hypothetical protein BKA69DRAFT_1041993 [Paraphysoderma sedebokerense]